MEATAVLWPAVRLRQAYLTHLTSTIKRTVSTIKMIQTTTPKKCSIAIVGGGITGAAAAQILSKQQDINVHLFDQGQRGVGGRSSHRNHTNMRWDHGCQFFRADTQRFKTLVDGLLAKDLVKEWKGNFISSDSCEFDFFGLPSLPPYYVGSDGMQSVAKGILDQIGGESDLSLHTGTRVAELERDEANKKWKLFGASGTAAFHDTPEKTVQQLNKRVPLGELDGFDVVILTDLSSAFAKWHRASAGVPEQFAARVRERVGSRVPLFTTMIAFDNESGIPFDAATFDNSVIWFAAKNNSKPGMDEGLNECWTLVSTPEYAMKEIEDTPMQDPKTGDFIPQSQDYLTSVPGPDLYNAFCKELLSNNGILGDKKLTCLPELIHMDAQRWGSALPCHRHLDEKSATRKVISGVPYDSGRSSLAPTKLDKDENTFLSDEDLMLFQAGDMMSSYSPGFEGAAISGMDAAERVLEVLDILQNK